MATRPAGGSCRSTATLYRLGRSPWLTGVPAAALAPLAAPAHVAIPLPGGAFRVVAAPVPLYRERPLGGVPGFDLPAGLEPAALELLRRAGVDVTVVGRPPEPLPAPDRGVLARYQTVDHSLLDAVRHNPSTIVRHGAAVDPAALVAQIAVAWPARRLAAVVPTIEGTRRLRDALRRLGVDAVSLNCKKTPASVGRVVVCTFMGLGDTEVAVEWLDLVVAVDARAAVGQRALECLGFAWRARLVGLLPADAAPSPLERDVLACLFGLGEVSIPKHDHVKRPVATACYPVKGGPLLPQRLEGVALRRRGLWQHPVRNRHAARLARAFHTGDADAVCGMLGTAAVPAGGVGVDAGVVVLAANVEHALALAARLPGWPVVAGPDVYTAGLSSAQVDRLCQLPDPYAVGAFYAVVTATALACCDLAGVAVLVRADGGVGLPALTDGALVAPGGSGPPRPLLLVDCDDRHHPALRREARRRRGAYAARGWFAAGADPLAARVDRFLATRPRRTNHV